MFIGRKEQYVISLKDSIDEEFYNFICMSTVKGFSFVFVWVARILFKNYWTMVTSKVWVANTLRTHLSWVFECLDDINIKIASEVSVR